MFSVEETDALLNTVINDVLTVGTNWQDVTQADYMSHMCCWDTEMFKDNQLFVQ